MTAPRFSFKPEITLGAIFSAVLWLCSAAWYVSASASDLRESQHTDLRHDVSLARIEREGSELARGNTARIVVLERRIEDADKILRQVSETLARVDENVKQQLKGRASP